MWHSTPRPALLHPMLADPRAVHSAATPGPTFMKPQPKLCTANVCDGLAFVNGAMCSGTFPSAVVELIVVDKWRTRTAFSQPHSSACISQLGMPPMDHQQMCPRTILERSDGTSHTPEFADFKEGSELVGSCGYGNWHSTG